MLIVLAGCPAASLSERLAMLVNDPELPADIRAEIARRAFPDRRVRAPRPATDVPGRVAGAASTTARPVETISEAALEALIAIVCDANARAKTRRKVAVKLAMHFLPMKPVNKRWRAVSDNYGFAINGERAREYRDIDFELHKLEGHPNRDLTEIAQKIVKLKKKKHGILERLQSPCPSRYGQQQFAEDYLQLLVLARKREAGVTLTAEEDYEEAHRLARFDCYKAGPEKTARRYRQDLAQADLLFRKSRFYKDRLAAPPSRKQRNDLRLLRWLYPPLENKSRQVLSSNERWAGHPFYDYEPWPDGNMYPDIPPYCYCYSGKTPIFSYEPPEEFYKRYNKDLTLANPDAIPPGT
jgi:hypothetical protein